MTSGGRSPQAAALALKSQAAATAAAAVTDGAALETTSADGGTVISRGFAKAMDAFEDSLRVAADAELGSTGAGSKQQQQRAKKDSSGAGAAAATRTSSASGSQKSRETTIKVNPLYRPVARGLGLTGRQQQSPAFRGEGAVDGVGQRGGSLSSLTVCARRPLLGAIAKGGPRSSSSVVVVVAPEAGEVEGCRSDTDAASDEDVSVSGNTAASGAPHGKRQQRQQRLHNQHQAARGGGGGGGVEVQVWNYRTKRLFVRHRFGGGGDSSSGDGGGGGGENLVGSVIPTGGDNHRGGGGGMEADAEGGGGDGDATCPVAVSLHPSGDSIAVAFPHYVNVFYIVGSGGEAVDDQNGAGGGDGVVDMAAFSKDTSSMSLQQTGVAETVAASDMAPLATLRSDQREFLTKGMFSVSGEQEQVINCDPVSAVHYSPGGHLLAVVTGKVS